jgi:hypothetical protein
MGKLEHFEIPANDPDRASAFCEKLFGWKIQKVDEPSEYWIIDTSDNKGKTAVGGGIYRKEKPTEGVQPTSMLLYFTVDNLNESSKKVKELGGQLLSDKIEVTGMGNLYTCADTEGNQFAIWEDIK